MTFHHLKIAKYTGRTKVEQLAYVRRQVELCEKCPGIVQARTRTVFGEGDPDAALMFVGEAPGVSEDEVGKPFIGPAGQLLTQVIHALGADRRDVYIANVLKCRPDVRPGVSNRAPTQPEIQDCAPYLLAQIKIVAPVTIVALGATAMGALGINDGVNAARGRWYRLDGIPLTVSFHPAYVLRGPTEAVRRMFWRDIKAAWEACGLATAEDGDWLPVI